MIASPNHSDRGGARVNKVVIHSAEGARRAVDLGNYFLRTDIDASSHVGIDDNVTIQYVPYDRASWTLLNGNRTSDNAELCAFARWNRDEWFAHQGMLDRAAAWIRERCQARGIPIRKLSPNDIDAGASGVIGHADWTYSKIGDGDHTDPGPNFPWGYVIAKAQGGEPLPGDNWSPGAKPAVEFPLAAGHYFGDIEGPDESHGGFWADEQIWVAQVQRALQAAGKAPSYAGWADGIWESPTTESMKAWQASVGRQQTGTCSKEEWDILVRGQAAGGGGGGAPAPTPQPPSGAPAWPLPRDHYFGDIAGPERSHGGYYAHERGWVKQIQQALIRKGYVPNITDPNSGWADGKFEQPTTDAVIRFQRAEMPGTTYFGQVWWDDWARLLA